ncbi:MAG: Holliday junction resolvase RuvX [Lachnospiraceae bacterium]|nr:Holliday junction resolvase RuvX [Lachnospiraceae bacterium]
MTNFRLLGLDFGAATVGVAGSDDLFLTAQPIEVIRRKHETKLRQTYARIEELAKARNVNALVVGYPKKLDNSVGERAAKTEDFAADLERRTGLPVVLWDERFTTVEAHRVLDAAGTDRKTKETVVDKLAAALILQSYMDYLTNNPDAVLELTKKIEQAAAYGL